MQTKTENSEKQSFPMHPEPRIIAKVTLFKTEYDGIRKITFEMEVKDLCHAAEMAQVACDTLEEHLVSCRFFRIQKVEEINIVS